MKKVPLSLAGSRLTATGAQFDADLPQSDWKRLWGQLQAVEKARCWILGDWINFGSARYGEKYAMALQASEVELQTLKTCSWVCRKIEPERRREGLSFSHHIEVAPLAPETQDEFLVKAEEEGWSVSDLRRALRERDGEKREDPLPRAFLPAVWAQEGLRWFRGQAVEDWPAARRQKLKEELKPLVELFEKL